MLLPTEILNCLMKKKIKSDLESQTFHHAMFLEKKIKSWGDVLQSKTKQSELIMHHMSQRL